MLETADCQQRYLLQDGFWSVWGQQILKKMIAGILNAFFVVVFFLWSLW